MPLFPDFPHGKKKKKKTRKEHIWRHTHLHLYLFLYLFLYWKSQVCINVFNFNIIPKFLLASPISIFVISISDGEKSSSYYPYLIYLFMWSITLCVIDLLILLPSSLCTDSSLVPLWLQCFAPGCTVPHHIWIPFSPSFAPISWTGFPYYTENVLTPSSLPT